MKKLIDRSGAKPMSSLGDACPNLVCLTMVRLSDLAFCLSLKIGGPSTLRAPTGRRLALRLRDIGLLWSARYLDLLYGKRRVRGAAASIPQPELPLQIPILSSVSVDGSVVKSSMPEVLPEDPALKVLGSLNIPLFRVGDK